MPVDLDVIRQLPDVVANQIAAGEVIQRPASVVKELIENSLDAGATRIVVKVQDAGKTLIEVSDNGCGMSENDARMCFERHATSKISTADDLQRIRTLGFRGEALASIAAVAQVELRTRRKEQSLGTCVVIAGGEVQKQEPVRLAEGTTLSVRNLFFNVPARRAFLKSPQTELRQIIVEFQRQAIARPDVSMELIHNDVFIFSLGPASLRQRIVHIMGGAVNEKLVPVSEKTDVLHIEGFIGKPQAAKKTRGDQFVYVNRRFVHSPYIHRAVADAYDPLLEPNTHPLFVLFLDVDPGRVDVNVHPTKQEVRFDDERMVYAFIQASVRHALARFSITPTLDFQQETAFDQLPAFSSTQSTDPTSEENKEVHSAPIYLTKQRPKHWQKLFEGMRGSQPLTVVISHPEDEEAEATPPPEEASTHSTPPYQLHRSYIISPIKSGFILIDQQAAHERILYEKYLTLINAQQPATQQQLLSQTVHFSQQDATVVQELLPDLHKLGFDIQPFGGTTFVVQGLPADLPNVPIQELLEQMIEAVKEEKVPLRIPPRERLALVLARRACLKSGQALTVKEMQELIDQLFACQSPFVTPTGRLTMITFDENDIAALFRQGRER